MNQLIIKGTWEGILALPHDHPANECGLVFISENHRVTTCKTYADVDDLNRWFCDDSPNDNGEYAVGSLLHWSPSKYQTACQTPWSGIRWNLIQRGGPF